MKKSFVPGCAALLLCASCALSASAANLTHTVAKGDTMWKLAVQYETGTQEIIDANPQVSNPNLIYPGQILTIPQSDATVSAYWNGIANTVILPMSELYTSMQMGSIDGFEHGVASAISNNLQEVAKYFTNVNWQWQYMPSFMASTYLYDELDPEVIALLEECANEAAKKYYDLYKEMYEDGLKFLEESGVQVYIPTAEEQKQWDDYGYSLYEGLAKEYGCEDLIAELVEISNAYKAANGK